MNGREILKRNLAIMWFSNFFVGGSMTMVLPFISLYIDTFGDFSDQYVQQWSGIAFGATFVTAFLFSPAIGRIGDRHGRKKLLVMLGTGMSLSLFLMGIVDTVWQLFTLRLFMGLFAGLIPVTQAFISTQTPKEMAGKVLGTLQTGSIAGTLLGPLAGGLLADTFGYAVTFRWTSAILFISVLLIMAAKEYKLETEENSTSSYSKSEVIRLILQNPALATVLFISMLVQVAHFSIQPILSLFVGSLHGTENLAFYSGLAFSAAGAGNLIMARKWGDLADKSGYLKILLILLLAGAIIYFPGVFVTDVWQLIALRFGLGITLGGIIPVRMAYIRQEAPVSIQGEVLGYNTSFRFLGNILGPLLGGFMAANFGFQSVFVVTSALLIISAFTLLLAVRKAKTVQELKSRLEH